MHTPVKERVQSGELVAIFVLVKTRHYLPRRVRLCRSLLLKTIILVIILVDLLRVVQVEQARARRLEVLEQQALLFDPGSHCMGGFSLVDRVETLILDRQLGVLVNDEVEDG